MIIDEQTTTTTKRIHATTSVWIIRVRCFLIRNVRTVSSSVVLESTTRLALSAIVASLTALPVLQAPTSTPSPRYAPTEKPSTPETEMRTGTGQECTNTSTDVSYSKSHFFIDFLTSCLYLNNGECVRILLVLWLV